MMADLSINKGQTNSINLKGLPSGIVAKKRADKDANGFDVYELTSQRGKGGLFGTVYKNKENHTVLNINGHTSNSIFAPPDANNGGKHYTCPTKVESNVSTCPEWQKKA
jgi:hypothetical protein